MSGRNYTWCNNQQNRIMLKIDRIFCTTKFDATFPLASSEVLPIVGSDHTPIFWGSGVDQIPKKTSFKFEKWWTTRPDFKELVSKAWNSKCQSNSHVDICQHKVRVFRRLSRGWSSNIEALLRKNKKELMLEFDAMDIKSETDSLSEVERYRLNGIFKEL